MRKNELKEMDSYTIPPKVQGIAFADDGRVFLSTSLGRTKILLLRIYHSLEALNEKPTKPMQKVEMPPCSEELEILDRISIFSLNPRDRSIMKERMEKATVCRH